jgi:hypothetical protein
MKYSAKYTAVKSLSSLDKFAPMSSDKNTISAYDLKLQIDKFLQQANSSLRDWMDSYLLLHPVKNVAVQSFDLMPNIDIIRPVLVGISDSGMFRVFLEPSTTVTNKYKVIVESMAYYIQSHDDFVAQDIYANTHVFIRLTQPTFNSIKTLAKSYSIFWNVGFLVPRDWIHDGNFSIRKDQNKNV